MSQDREYDVALSLSGHDRRIAEDLANLLTASGVSVFYDKFESATLWGEDLYSYLADIYRVKARFCIIIISEHYASSLWTSHERRFAQARAFRENRAYILPVRLDDTELPGIAETTGHVDLRTISLIDVVALVQQKLTAPESKRPEPKSWESALMTYAHAMKGRLSELEGISRYVPLRFEDLAGNKGLVDERLSAWLNDPTERVLFLLGDYGTGKTTFCQHLARTLCEALATGHSASYIPVLAPIRDVESLLGSRDSVQDILRRCGVPSVPQAQARYLLMFDGYDEISSENQRAFHFIIRSLMGHPTIKTFVTARSHFFRSEHTASLIFAQQTGRGTGLGDLETQVSWVNDRVLHLQPFDDGQVRTYLDTVFPDSRDYFAKIVSIYDLHDLAHRPILLSLITGMLPTVDEADVITQDSLYERTVTLWLDRDSWRGLDAAEMISFTEDLATTMFLRRLLNINYRDLSAEVRKGFEAKILSRMDLEYLDSLIRTSGFLYRDGDGNFSFMHRSFLEYFFARVLRKRISSGSVQLLEGSEFTTPVYFDLTSSWKLQEEKAKAMVLVNERLAASFDEAYALSDGVIELLASSLRRSCPTHLVTQRVSTFVQKREQYRAEERALHQHAARMRGKDTPNMPEPVQSSASVKAFDRVSMIGGGGRIYYTTEHYSFSLFVNTAEPQKSQWAFVLGYHESWRHT